MPDERIDRLKVAEAMKYDFGRVDKHMPVGQVINLMLENRWDEVMVTDHDQGFVGIATKEHLVKCVSSGFSQERPIKEICCQDIIYTHEQESLSEARDTMRMRRIGRLPVLNCDKKVVGMLTSMDVCNGFSFKMENLSKYMYAVMENIAEAIQVIYPDGTVNVWNDSAEKLFGIKAKDIMGRNLADFFPDDIMLQVSKTLKPHHNIFCELQEGVYAVRNALPVITASGKNIGVVCTSLNVSKEKSLIEKLDQATHRVKALEGRKMSCIENNDDSCFYTVNTETKLCLERAKRVGNTDATVLIQGESGTGKELMANVIYCNSKRNKCPFIDVNCSAIPEALFESEMFGYGPGTFTGGNRLGKPGKFEMAHGGTLFLDEIGEMSLGMQTKMLRVIQEQKFYRVGGTTPVNVDVRIIAATNQDLFQLVADNKFREDLYYRLNVVNLEIAPLRRRKDDIPGLVRRFIAERGCKYEGGIKHVEQEVLDLLMAYDWPGNVRQLHNLLESVIIFTEGECVTMDSLSDAGVLDMLISKTKSGPADKVGEKLNLNNTSLDDLMQSQERDVIFTALENCGFNKSETAKLLGIPRSTLYYKMNFLGISSALRGQDLA